jgi:hypothetical protein
VPALGYDWFVRVSVLIVCLATATAAAQDAPPPTEGSKLFEEGRELAKQNKFAEACAKFEQSYVLDNGVGTELNLADCHEHLGHFAQAWRYFDDASQRSSDNPARAKFAHDRAIQIGAKLATAVINLAEPDAAGLSVTIAGRAVKARTVITERVDPGSIAVHVATPDKVVFDGAKQADAGATVIFDVGSPATVTSVTEPAHDDGEPDHRRRNRVIISYAVGGVGLATLATGIVIGLVADHNYRNDTSSCSKDGSGGLTCDPAPQAKAISDGKLADTATIISVVGAVAIAAGIVVYLTAPKDLVVAPMTSNQTAGLAISGRF